MDKFAIMGDSSVSVILPVYNGERYLAEAIGCVLRQNYQAMELIIIDDGSTDATSKIASGFGDAVRYFHQSNSGPAAARNFGIQKAKGDYIAFIDADDLWPDDKLRFQMNCFEAFPEIEIVQGVVRRIRLPDFIQGRTRSNDDDIQFINTNLGAMVIRRSVFDKVGYFEENLIYHEDSDFWLRAREMGIKILVQRKVSLIYRIHNENLTTGMDITTMGFMNILKKSIDRRRKSYGCIQQIPKLTFIPDLLQNSEAKECCAKPEMSTWPPISIILHVGINKGYAAKALESIRKQDYRPIELVIVGSHLEEVQVLAGDLPGQVKCIEQDSPDLGLQLNAALAHCTGEMIAFLDSDAEWTPGKLKIQAAYLMEHPDEGYIMGRSRHIIDPSTRYPADLMDSFYFRKSLGDMLDTMLVRRSTFERVGGFMAGLPGMQETDWLLRASDLGFSKNILPAVFLYRFVKPDFQLYATDQMKAALLESVRASVRRKRAEL